MLGVGHLRRRRVGARRPDDARWSGWPALVATEAPGASYQWGVGVALAAGASEDEIVDLLLVLAPIVGVARVNAAAPELGVALGYDMDDLAR